MDLLCDECGGRFTSTRGDARYCSGRCRTIAYRRRLRPAGPAPRRRPLGDDMRAAALDLSKSVRRWRRIADDDRFARAKRDSARYRADLVRARDEIDAIISGW